jgi:hypothetical protein
MIYKDTRVSDESCVNGRVSQHFSDCDINQVPINQPTNKSTNNALIVPNKYPKFFHDCCD